MTTPHLRRVPNPGTFEATYALAAGEQFRIDAVTFAITSSPDGNPVVPTLIARNPGNAIIQQIEATAAVGAATPTFAGMSYTGPAVMADAFSVLAPSGYSGYLLHDFGAVPTTSQITVTGPLPPGTQMSADELWLRSAGAVAIGGIIGESIVTATDTVTVTLGAGVLAGHHVLLHLVMLSPVDWLNPQNLPRIVVTDSAGGNSLDPPTAALGEQAPTSLRRTDGLYLASICNLWRVVTPLGAGATITVRVPSGPSHWMQLDAHDVTGLTAGNPIGPNAGGNYVQIGQSPGVSPFVSTANPVPKWVGPVLINDSYVYPLAGDLDVMLGRGIYTAGVSATIPALGASVYTQAGMSELVLTDSDTLTAISLDGDGQPRAGDAVTGFTIWAVDVGEDG